MAALFGEIPLGLVSQILNLAAVLTRKAGLKVPRYQRPFTWGDREVRELIQDLWRAFERGATFYFIGQIVLVKNEQGKLEISDGQQRLATLTMIIAYARDRLPAKAEQYQTLIMSGELPRLLLREEDASFYLGYVQEPGRMAALAKLPESGKESKDLLAAAAATIDSELKQLKDDVLDAFLSYVVRCCTLNVVDADERGCAQTVFNTLNKRGSPLSGADIIKSDLIENAELDPHEADLAARKWEEVEDMFERENFAHLLYTMPFLLTGEPLLSPGDLGAFRAAVDRAGGVRKFLFNQLPRFADALRAIFAASIDVGAVSADVNRRVRVMKQVEKWDWAPAAIAYLAHYDGDAEAAQRFFQALDRFVFACELGVIDNRLREKRYSAATAGGRDARQLCGPGGALELTESEHTRFIATLNRSRKRDRQRRLLLIRVEAAMPGGSILEMTDDVTAEHILPKGSSAWWDERFPDPQLRVEAANMLGNLTLITHDQNKRADNRSYPEKRRVFFETPGAPVHALTRDTRGIEEWSLEAIDFRQERLVRIISEDWGLIRGPE